MKSLFTFCVLLSLSLISCKVSEKPNFITVENIELQNISAKDVSFKANAIFENKNVIGGTIITDSIQVFADNLWIGNIIAEPFKIPAKDTFSVPLQGNFSTAKLLNQNAGDLLSNVINMFKKRKVDLTLRGDLLFKKGLLKYKYHVDKTNSIKF